MPTTRILLIRHADVENPRRVLYGHLHGFALSALGRAQSEALGRRLQQNVPQDGGEATGLARIVHSPLLRAQETAELIAGQLPSVIPLTVDSELREAEFSRYLQGVPYWQIPVRRPLWFVHKARRGLLPGDEPVDELGGRILRVMHRVAADHPEEVSALVSHADPLQAAWALLDGRPATDREMYQKQVEKAGLLDVELDGAGQVRSVTYVGPPKVEPAAASATAAE
jgi:broad specificity phosphatase PhoE